MNRSLTSYKEHGATELRESFSLFWLFHWRRCHVMFLPGLKGKSPAVLITPPRCHWGRQPVPSIPELFTEAARSSVMKSPPPTPELRPPRILQLDEFWVECVRTGPRTVASWQHRPLRPYVTSRGTNSASRDLSNSLSTLCLYNISPLIYIELLDFWTLRLVLSKGPKMSRCFPPHLRMETDLVSETLFSSF
jgi:hypothetical protein